MIRRLWFLAVLPLWPVVVFAQDNDANYMDGGHMNGYGHMMGPWSGGGVVMWIILLIVAGVLIYFLVKGLGPGGSGPTASHETALDILKKRYARGEITKEQFDEMKNDL